MSTQDISLDMIDESPTNPRKRFDPTALAELAASIAAKGAKKASKKAGKGGG